MSEKPQLSQSKQCGWLVVVFLAWKTLLLVIAALTPGPGYDTSGFILVGKDPRRHVNFTNQPWLDRAAIKLFRWDSLYFVKTAQRGYVYEQEWAFSWAYSALLRTVTTSLFRNTDPPLLQFILAGVAVSSVAHLISVMIMYKLLDTICRNRSLNPHTPFIACILHILSPAGLFLVAPYSEAPFAVLNFAGFLCYANARATAKSGAHWTLYHDIGILSSAIFFGVATWVRGNGIFSGAIFLSDVVVAIPSIMASQFERRNSRRIGVTCVAGVLMGLISIVPQYLAFKVFCGTGRTSEARPWCRNTVPSIYTWVQSEYWNVGFLRYWTLSNLPLFLMAAPMLWLLLKSGTTYMRSSTRQSPDPSCGSISTHEIPHHFDTESCGLPQLALPELLLVVAAITNFHVQIINRISSGYPIWYLSVATWITNRGDPRGTDKTKPITPLIVRGMVLYCVVQGVLFAGFLPPA